MYFPKTRKTLWSPVIRIHVPCMKALYGSVPTACSQGQVPPDTWEGILQLEGRALHERGPDQNSGKKPFHHSRIKN